MKTLFIPALVLLLFSFAQAQSELAPIVEREFEYKNWNFKKLDGGEAGLREMAAGKKLVLVVYFAPWCANWRFQAPYVQRFYEKYKDQGFEVIGVAEYDSVAAVKANVQRFGLTFPIVYESESLSARLQTTHYAYRSAIGDTRKWGSPLNVFVTSADLKPEGDVAARKLYVSAGELIEKEAESFIREKLGLPKEESKQVSLSKPVEPCKQ